ncbi:competence protein ComER [Alkalibacillus filiformis]|uniref:Pyrroline-5-carboxylate reductase n=1 Tax=Alkalibacillus filiformis TaxID=200990 RepID=A0ABU0DRZ3_9BACI|nr:late competence protein ComER [Alkalibacillus filiformis]MDQ0351086.1 competence protein ComER [Alkalibacillus filiformis]
MNWGIIGTGNMGTVIMNALIKSNAVDERNIYVNNRTFLKAYELKEDYPGIHVLQTVDAIADTCDVIFLCTKPKEIVSVAHRLNGQLNEKQLVVSITSSVSVDHLEQLLGCQTARMIPSITNRVLQGTTLLTFGSTITEEMKQMLTQTCKLFSSPLEINDQYVRVASDLVSCGPAFISYLLQSMIKAAQEETGIDEETATQLVETMMIGYGKLLDENLYDLNSLKEKVMVKGGITGEGMKALELCVPNGLNEVFKATHEKFYNEQNHADELVNQLTTKN